MEGEEDFGKGVDEIKCEEVILHTVGYWLQAIYHAFAERGVKATGELLRASLQIFYVTVDTTCRVPL